MNRIRIIQERNINPSTFKIVLIGGWSGGGSIYILSLGVWMRQDKPATRAVPIKMMRESVSHPNNNAPAHKGGRSVAISSLQMKLQWAVLICVGSMTILAGIAVLVALMSPENLRTAPTIALVCVLVLLCVPVPVLMLERGHRRSAIKHSRTASEPQVSHAGHVQHVQYVQQLLQAQLDPSDRQPIANSHRQAVIHQPHQPHDSSPDNHRVARTATEQRQSPSSS